MFPPLKNKPTIIFLRIFPAKIALFLTIFSPPDTIPSISASASFPTACRPARLQNVKNCLSQTYISP